MCYWKDDSDFFLSIRHWTQREREKNKRIRLRTAGAPTFSLAPSIQVAVWQRRTLWRITNECVNCLLLATLVGMRSQAAGVDFTLRRPCRLLVLLFYSALLCSSCSTFSNAVEPIQSIEALNRNKGARTTSTSYIVDMVAGNLSHTPHSVLDTLTRHEQSRTNVSLNSIWNKPL